MKRILSLVLVLSMVLSMFTFASASSLTDVTGTKYEPAIEALMALGVVSGYPDHTYLPGNVVTRAELAKLLVTAYGLSQAAEVASGTTSISQDGQFTIPFMPKADSKLNKNIYYRFKVTAEVTDEGGETREAIKEYPIGFISVQANIQKKYNYFLPNEVISLDIINSDLGAVPQSGAGEYKLVALEIPDKVMTPDQLPRSAEHFGKYAIAGDKVRSRWEPDKPLEQYLYFLFESLVSFKCSVFSN